MTTTFTSRELDRNPNGAERATGDGPVFITERGRPTHVLMKIEDFQALSADHVEVKGREE